MESVWINPVDDSILISMRSLQGYTTTHHFPNALEAEKSLTNILGILDTSLTSVELSSELPEHLAIDLHNEFKLLPHGKEGLIRLKLIRTTKNFNVYSECDSKDVLSDEGSRRIGTTYVKKRFVEAMPNEFIAIHVRGSRPMLVTNYEDKR